MPGKMLRQSSVLGATTRRKLLRPFSLLYGFLMQPSSHTVDVARLRWLEAQMADEDRERFPMRAELLGGWADYIAACHHYIWNHVVVRPH